MFSVASSGAYRVSVKTGDSITIPCPYHHYYIKHSKYLCKGDHFDSCSHVVHAKPPKGTAKASVFDDINQLTMIVTMTDLEPGDSARYYCAVEVNGGINVRAEWFHLSVIPGKISATLPYDHMTGVLVLFTGITIIVQVDMRNVGICLLSVLYPSYHHYDICGQLLQNTLDHSGTLVSVPLFSYSRTLCGPTGGDRS